MDDAGNQGVFASKSSPERPMPDEIIHPNPRKPRWKRRMTLIFALVALIAAAVVLPPLINISSYQRQITALMSRSLGRPVHLSGVELRLLPRPGFVLHDLSVSEDPKFGAEPVLSARTVVAAIRISSLWRGRLTVDRISVDEASLNLVRSAQGLWNLQSVMMDSKLGIPQPANTGSAPNSPTARRPLPFPYLEATNSRVNLKNGVEKSPFSIVNTELSLWQDDPGVWRLRLRGQPARTDMEISSGDTGEVRLEATLNAATPARELREMPFKLQAEWREAQLGQLSRLILGSDAGWRGDLTADVEVQGTPDAAQTKARLRATSVRRAEFAPETPLDFDANCSFRYQHAQNAVHDLACDTAIGDGLLHLKADLPGISGQPEAMLEVKQLPLQAGLDLLRTVRSDFSPGITIRGTANGSVSLMPAPVAAPKTGKQSAAARQSSKAGKKGIPKTPELNLQGGLVVDGGELRGGSLKQPIRLPKMTWIPALVSSVSDGSGAKTGLSSRFTVALSPSSASAPAAVATPTPSSEKSSGPAPTAAAARLHTPQPLAKPHEITVRLGLAQDGYNVALNGSAGVTELRDLAYAFGAPHLDAADSLTAGVADIDFSSTGPWIASGDVLFLDAVSNPAAAGPVVASPPPAGHLAGSIQLHHAEWRTPYLARPLELSLGTLAVIDSALSMTSGFNYGPLEGAIIVNANLECVTPACQPQIHLHLGAVDAGQVQTTLLGAPEKTSLLSPLVNRVRTSDKPVWPTAAIDVQADSLTLGAVKVVHPALHIKADGSDLQIESWEGALLGGSGKGQGRFSWTSEGPKYDIDGDFTGVSPAALATALEGVSEEDATHPWSGGPLSGHVGIQLSGLTDKQFAASATGSVHFSWPHGSIPAVAAAHAASAATASPAAASPVPESLPAVRFDDWTGTATLHSGQAQLGENVMRQGKRLLSITGAIPFGAPAKLAVASPPVKSALPVAVPAAH